MAATRSTSEVFLIGHSSPKFPPGVLPTNLDILREVLWKKETLGDNQPLNSIISCPLGMSAAMCEEGCLRLEKDKYCTVQKTKLCWIPAGIKTVVEVQIRSNIAKLWNEFRELKKKRNRIFLPWDSFGDSSSQCYL